MEYGTDFQMFLGLIIAAAGVVVAALIYCNYWLFLTITDHPEARFHEDASVAAGIVWAVSICLLIFLVLGNIGYRILLFLDVVNIPS